MTPVEGAANSPVCVANVVLQDYEREYVVMGVRKKTPLEKRHILTLSTITKAVPPPYFDLLLRDLGWDAYGNHGPADIEIPIGRGAHDENTHAYVMDATLGKIGIAEALAAGRLAGTALRVHHTYSLVPDKDTETSQWTSMLHYNVILDKNAPLYRIPPASELYNPILSVDAAKLGEAYRTKDLSRLGDPRLDNVLLCIFGDCVAGALQFVENDYGS
jgi:hypothetical protein